MIELLAPAGNLEKLKFAFEYGADAVYLGYKKFSLRNLSGNFSIDEIKFAKEYALKRNKKIFITLNIYPYNEDLAGIISFLEKITTIEPDALIVSDPGIIYLVQKYSPNIPIHLSTQANTTNYLAVNYWKTQGIKRINLARELSLSDIKEIREKNKDIELEVFIHGAMCMSMSGRCLLSNFLTTRPSNKGECTHPCRWQYYVMEATREGEYFPIEENNRGSYIFNSKDLCGIRFLPDLISMNISSIKIEGRMKSIYYVANVVRVYRKAIDSYYNNPENFKIKKEWIEELNAVSNRGYTEGFFEKRNQLSMHNYNSSGYIRKYQFMGTVIDVLKDSIIIEARNKIFKGEEVEIITNKFDNYKVNIDKIYSLDGKELDFVQPMNKFVLKKIFENLTPMSIIRKKIDEN